jgi:hypothetical protein
MRLNWLPQRVRLAMDRPVGPVARLAGIVVNVPAAVSRYGVRDDCDVSMDTLKIIESRAGRYLGVYHAAAGGRFAVHLATSTDLLTWRHRAVLDEPASQPTIAATPDGGFLLATEAGGSGGPAWLRFQYFPDLDRLMHAAPARAFDAPHTLVPPDQLAEGTPTIYSVSAGAAAVDVAFHYFRDGVVDRQARGRLRDFRQWTTHREPRIDAAIEAWGVRGNVGDRDHLTFEGAEVDLVEGQLRPGRWDAWRLFLYQRGRGVARPLPVRTHRGSRSFGNPTVTALTAPSGAPALVVTLFLFPEGAAEGEGGQLVYYREL